jgi:dTDP-4-dehydrorhamnose reductase
VIRVIVTGARGQVGTEVLRSRAGRAHLAAHDRATLDLSDPGAIAARVREERPDAIVNCAAYTAVDRAETDEAAARAVNAVAPGVLGEEARRCGALLLHFSTDYVFDGTREGAYTEDDATAPLGAYGRTKLEGERAVAQSGARHLTLRTSWVYGPHGRNFMLTMLAAARTREELRIVDDQHGAPTSSLQLARLVGELLGGAGGSGEITRAQLEAAGARAGLYHASAAGSTTWFGFATAIFELAGNEPGLVERVPRLVPIPTSAYPTPARRPANSVLSSARLQGAFGTRIGGWRAGLAEAIARLPRTA